ncbi:MAG TPA: rod shape-determining protein MreC [Aggregatilineales bacterium]|nr:rod shape-determining protein MreC [Aggregatilineales bacterium]
MQQGTRTFTIIMAVAISVILLVLSALGTLGPAEGIAQVPVSLLESVFGEPAGDLSNLTEELSEVRTLRERNRELEQALTSYQSELAELRAFRSDYDRLVELANYVGQVGQEWRYVSADVIGRDLNGVVRTIHINAGTRNGVSSGDPVVTELGLVGRVTRVSAIGAEVLLISDQNSAVNARVLNEAREPGLLRGSLSGELILDFLDINGAVEENQQVFTSGETQGFPPNILLGQISSVRISSDELFQQATVNSLVDFDSLQVVLVITNWEPVDLEVFQEVEPVAP